MAKKYFFALGILTLAFAGCETVNTPTGPRSVLRPEGAAILNTVVSTGIGAGTGALMNKSPGWAAGAVGGAAGSIGSQVVGAFLPTRQNIQQQTIRQSYPVQPAPYLQSQPQYQPGYNTNR